MYLNMNISKYIHIDTYVYTYACVCTYINIYKHIPCYDRTHPCTLTTKPKGALGGHSSPHVQLAKYTNNLERIYEKQITANLEKPRQFMTVN